MAEFEDKWVRIMADFCADAVWCSDGAASHPDEIPISDGLREMLCAWNRWYDRECVAEENYAMPNLKQFVDVGFLLAQCVKRQLPSGWTVIYHDEEKAANKPALNYEYEIYG